MVLGLFQSCWFLPTGFSPCSPRPLFPYGAITCTCLPTATLSESLLEAESSAHSVYGPMWVGEWGPLVQVSPVHM